MTVVTLVKAYFLLFTEGLIHTQGLHLLGETAKLSALN